jgi:hypothetical protein
MWPSKLHSYVDKIKEKQRERRIGEKQEDVVTDKTNRKGQHHGLITDKLPTLNLSIRRTKLSFGTELSVIP